MRVAEENNDDVFDEVFADKQQSDLINAIGKLIEKLQPQNNNEIKLLFNQVIQSNQNFLRKIEEISKPEISIPQAQINISNDELAKEIKVMNTNTSLLIEKLSKKREWIFEFKKDTNDNILSPIKAIEK